MSTYRTRIKQMALLLTAFCGFHVSAFSQGKQDSLQALFSMVQQLQQQQMDMSALMEKRRQDSLVIVELQQKLAEVQQGQSISADASRQALLSLEEARREDASRLYALQDSVQKGQERLADAVSQLKIYENKIESMESQQAQFSEVELRLKLGEEIKYKHIKRNLRNISILYELMNEKLNALDAFKQLGSYQTLLQDLNNPSSNTLGFSYNEKVLELMEQELLVEKDKNNGKIIGFAKTLLESPLAKGLKSMMPVVSTANSLLGFISGVSVERKDITEDRFKLFKAELERYTLYYARMNEANSQLEGSLVQYQAQIENLHDKLRDLTVANAKRMDMKVKEFKDKTTTGGYLLDVFQSYNQYSVDNYFKELEAAATQDDGLNYGQLLKNDKLQSMYQDTESAILLFRDFEKLYNQYLKIIYDNHVVVTKILEEAKENKLGKGSKIKDQIDRLSEAKESTKLSVRTAINLSRLSRVANQLSKFPPTL